MTNEMFLLITLQSGVLFGLLWCIFWLAPKISANAKAWFWRLAFLKPLLSLLPFAAVTLSILPAPKVDELGRGFGAALGSIRIQGPDRIAKLPPIVSPNVWSGDRSSNPAPLSIPSYSERPKIAPLIALWCAGMCVVIGYGLLGMRRSIKVLSEAEEVERADLREALQALLQRAGIRRSVRLLVSKSAPSVVLLGGRRYAIVLPKEIVEKGDFQDLRLMLAHEVAHIARRDMVWLGIVYTAQVLFFFNPMVWVASHYSRLDHESATDLYASQLAGVPIQTYADMLLRATVVMRAGFAPGSLSMAESYRTIHRRLQAMKHFNTKPTLKRKIAMAALGLVTLSLLPVYEFAVAAPLDFPEKPAPTKKAAPDLRPVTKSAKKDSPLKKSSKITKANSKKEKPVTDSIKPLAGHYSLPLTPDAPQAQKPKEQSAKVSIPRFEKGKFYAVEFLFAPDPSRLSGIAEAYRASRSGKAPQGAYKIPLENQGKVEFLAINIEDKEGLQALVEASEKIDELEFIQYDKVDMKYRRWLRFSHHFEGGSTQGFTCYSICFLLDGEGTVCWAGSPESLERKLQLPLEAGLNKEAQDHQSMIEGVAAIRDGSYRAVALSKKGNRAEALKLIEELEKTAKNDSQVIAAKLSILRQSEPAKVDAEIDRLISDSGKHAQDVVNSLINMRAGGDDALGRQLVEKVRKSLRINQSNYMQWVRMGAYWETLGGDLLLTLSDYENAKRCLNVPLTGGSAEIVSLDLDEKIEAVKRKIRG